MNEQLFLYYLIGMAIGLLPTIIILLFAFAKVAQLAERRMTTNNYHLHIDQMPPAIMVKPVRQQRMIEREVRR